MTFLERILWRAKALGGAIALMGLAAALFASGSKIDGGASNGGDGANWAIYGRTLDANHFSPLAQIDRDNVGKLGLAWSMDLDSTGSTYTSPIAVDGVLYFAQGYSVIHAVDAKTGKELWAHDPKVYDRAPAKMRASWGVRGIVYWDDRIYTGTTDGRLIALDARTGKEFWSVDTSMGPDDGRYITGAPWVYNGKVVIGHGGADFDPVRGYVTAYDAKTGKQLWRFFTVPGNPAVDRDETTQIAARTWTGQWWKWGGGGTVWNAMAYDAKYNRLYIGTGNGTPWNAKVRSPGGGDNLFLSSIVALDADTGKYVWHYQTNPGETWDYNAVMDIELATLPIDGKDRDVLLTAPKNGFFYVIDRATGKLISARNFVPTNWASGIDMKTGRPIENPDARFNGKGFAMSPGPVGGHNAAPMSLSPTTGLVYIPASENFMWYSDVGLDLAKWNGERLGGYLSAYSLDQPMLPLPQDKPSLLAWNPVSQKPAWSIPRPITWGGGVTSTAGNLVFVGGGDGLFKAYDAMNGKELWSFDAQTGISSQPITYMVDGVQYVSVLAGYRGIIQSSPWDYRTQPRRLLTFRIGGKAKLPATPAQAPSVFADDPSFKVDPDKAAIGQQAYFERRCYMCHGMTMEPGGQAPDLRRSGIPLDAAAFKEVVHNGALRVNGMPRFPELDDEVLAGLQHYIRQVERAAANGERVGRPAQVMRQ